MADLDREDLSQRANWRTLTLAFAVWAAHFGLVYVTALVAPGHPADGPVALAAGLAALAVLLRQSRRAAVPTSVIARSALAIGGFAVALQTLPPLLL